MENKVFKNCETFNDDPDATIFQRYGAPTWYISILKKPGWKKGVHYSLKTRNKEEAIHQAKIKYQELIGTNQVLQNSLFNPEDVKVATLRKGLGRICEDKFKNLMLVKGYQVYTPVEDIWGSDFLISQNGKDFYKVQVKSTAQTGKMAFHLLTNHSDKRPYRDLVDYMAFISIMDDKVWMIPVKELPNKTGMSLTELKEKYKNFTVHF